jgi:putative acyl-CoA dehydrogenase
VSKYWICKRGAPHAHEALECLGGNGFVEESGMPRLYREAPLNSIWEGSGNVACLDVLRAMVKSPESVEIFFDEIEQTAGSDARIGDAVTCLKRELSDFESAETRARHIVERMALTLQGALLVRHGDPAVADAFCASRLAGDWGHAFGTLPAGIDHRAIVDRHRPVAA